MNDHHQVPQQKNDYDCGLFVLYFIERFIEEAPDRLKRTDLDMVCMFLNSFYNISYGPGIHHWRAVMWRFTRKFSVWQAVVQTSGSFQLEDKDKMSTQSRVPKCEKEMPVRFRGDLFLRPSFKTMNWQVFICKMACCFKSIPHLKLVGLCSRLWCLASDEVKAISLFSS